MLKYVPAVLLGIPIANEEIINSGPKLCPPISHLTSGEVAKFPESLIGTIRSLRKPIFRHFRPPSLYGSKNYHFLGLILMKDALTTQVGMLGDIFLWLAANLKQWPFT